MPRRYYNYLPEFTHLHQLSSIGSYLMAVGFFVVAGYLLHSLFAGKRAPANPCGGATLEWRCASPPPWDNFSQPPVAGDPYDFSNVKYDPQRAGYVFAPPKPAVEKLRQEKSPGEFVSD
jgi:cytochrome c oxidase subunit 1